MIILLLNKHDKVKMSKKISVALALHQFYLLMTYLKIGTNHEPIAFCPYLSRE